MKTIHLQQQIALTFLHGIGPIKASLLVSKLGSLEAVFKENYSTLHQLTGISKNVLKQMKREDALKLAEEHVNYIDKHSINTHFYLDANYPRRLKQCVDAPLLLYSKGNFDPNPPKVISIVGTRNSTEYGKGLCEDFIQSITDNGIQVISGMAYGIDICAHQLCVRNNIETVGVLGHGLDRLYPSVHKRIAEQMIQNGGLITEFVPGTNPDRENFPMRNRIVAGMADACIVIESKRSGGSLITAQLANDYNRDVFAFPGNIGQQSSEGCNLLIKRDQAHLLTDGEAFLKEMNWLIDDKKNKAAQRSFFVDLNDTEKQICHLLQTSSGEHIDVISFQMKVPVSVVNVQLFHLEMKGLIKSLPGKKYCMI